MSERSEIRTADAGQHAAVAPWSARARLGVLVLVVGIVAATTALIMQSHGGPARAVITSSTSDSKSPATSGPVAGLSGSGIGSADAPSSRRASAHSAAPTTEQPSNPWQSTHTTPPSVVPPTSTTLSTTQSAGSPAPTHAPASPRPPSPAPSSPSPTPTKHCVPGTKICL